MLTPDAVATLKFFVIGERGMGSMIQLLDNGEQYLTEYADVNAAALSPEQLAGLSFIDAPDRTLDALDAFMWRAVPGLQKIQEYVRKHGGTEQSAPYRMAADALR